MVIQKTSDLVLYHKEDLRWQTHTNRLIPEESCCVNCFTAIVSSTMDIDKAERTKNDYGMFFISLKENKNFLR